MLLCKKIRLTISKKDETALLFMQGKCRGLYNWWIGKLKSRQKWNLYEAKASLQESKVYDQELLHVYGKLLAEVYFRIDKAMQAFFRRLKEGVEKPGFPRFKPRHRFFTLCYPGSYLQVDGHQITLPTGGKGKKKKYQNIVGILAEVPPAGFKEVAVSQDGRGNYHCSFVYETDVKELVQNSSVVAFDLGIKTLATGINDRGICYDIGGCKGYRWFNRQLDKIRVHRSKCNSGSRRYCFLSNVYSRLAERKQNKRKDSHHKASSLIAYKLAESAVVIGDLSQRQMVMKSNNKKRNRAVYGDWGLYSFVEMLKYKCELAGKQLHVISERDTSKACSSCHYKQDMPLYKRIYKCPECGLVMDRDLNSAINILIRFLARLEPHRLAKVCGVLGVSLQGIDTFTHV